MRQKKETLSYIIHNTDTNKASNMLSVDLTDFRTSFAQSIYVKLIKHNGTLIYISVTVIQQKKYVNFQISQITGLIALVISVIRGDKSLSCLSKRERCFKTLSPRQLIRN